MIQFVYKQSGGMRVTRGTQLIRRAHRRSRDCVHYLCPQQLCKGHLVLNKAQAWVCAPRCKVQHTTGLTNQNNPKSFFQLNMGGAGPGRYWMQIRGVEGTLCPFIPYLPSCSPQVFFLFLNTFSLSISSFHKYWTASLLILRLRKLGGPHTNNHFVFIVAFKL